MNINSIESVIKSESTVWNETFGLQDADTVKKFQKYLKKDFFKTWNVMPAFHFAMNNVGCYDVIGIESVDIYKNENMDRDYFNEDSGYCDLMITAYVKNYSRIVRVIFSVWESMQECREPLVTDTFDK